MIRGLVLFTMIAMAASPLRANTLAVVASTPTSGATSVPLQTTVTFTFNHPVDPIDIVESFVAEPEDALVLGDLTVSDDGRFVSVDVTHLADTDYTWLISGTYQDMNDGTLFAIEPFVLRYTTSAAIGNSAVSGQISVRDAIGGGIVGRRLPVRFEAPMSKPMFKEMERSGKERIKDGAPSDGQGMPTSTLVDPDPTGTVVILSEIDPLTTSDEEAIAGAAVVNGNAGTYEMHYVRPGEYFAYAMKVGMVDPDAPLGELLESMYFGYYDPDGDGIPNTITVPASGTLTAIDFEIAPLSYYAGTASEMEVSAREVADAYASDQQLVGISTFAVGALGKSATWTYNYFAPSTGMQTDVTVTPFDVEVIPMEYMGEEPPSELPMPYVDSDQAYLVGLLNGGEAFLKDYPMAVVTMSAGMQLDTSMGSGLDREDPYWAIAFLNFSLTRVDYLVVYVDFTTAEFLGSERAEPAGGKYSDRFREAVTEVSAVEGNFILTAMNAQHVGMDGVAVQWNFEFYAENTDTRAVVSIMEGQSLVESETPAGRPEYKPLGGIMIDSDVAIASALENGGETFINTYGMAEIALEAGDLSGYYPEMSESPAYLVSIYAMEGAGALWFRAVLDPTTGRVLHTEQSGGTASDPEPEVPASIVLGENYPNPFNPQTTVPFSIETASNARLTVHDLLGREVAVLVDGPMPVGAHEVTWDATDFASGVYVYRLAAGGQTATGKMILQK